MAFLYTPKSGSKIIARDATTPVVTLANGSHHVIGCFALPIGDGSRDQRGRWANIAEAIVSIDGGVAVDERGSLVLHMPRPGMSFDLLEYAGIKIDAGIGWRMLAEGWAEIGESGKACLHLGTTPDGQPLYAVPKLRLAQPLELVACYDGSDKGARWSYGEAVWHATDGVGADIAPAPTKVQGVDVGVRDWRELASCVSVCLDEQDDPSWTWARRAASWLAGAIRAGRDDMPIPSLPRGARPVEDLSALPLDGWRAVLEHGHLTVTAPDGGEATVHASAAEISAYLALRDSKITEPEAAQLTGCDAAIGDGGIGGVGLCEGGRVELQAKPDGWWRFAATPGEPDFGW
jgi:hypothetical protein